MSHSTLQAPPLITTSHTTRHQLRLLQIRESLHVIQSLDPERRVLGPLHWPVNAQFERLQPSMLREHRQTHQFLGPCCLCPLLARNSTRSFTEAAIFIATTGPYCGEYVAACARGRCGYLVLAERIYSKPGVPLKLYPLRGADEVPPPPVLHHSEIETENRIRESHQSNVSTRPLKRSYAVADLNEDPDTPIRQAPTRPPLSSAWRRFQRLDTVIEPGLTESKFQTLFTKCGSCGLVMTRRVLGYHRCREVIDLTLDETTEEGEE